MLVCDISIIHKYGKQTLDARLSPFDVCWQEMVVLMAIRRSPNVTISLLSKLLQTDKGNVTRLLNRMDSKGLISRLPMGGDHRRKALRPAPAGERLLPDLDKVMSDWERECLEGFSSDDIRIYLALNGKFIGNLMRMSEQSSSLLFTEEG